MIKKNSVSCEWKNEVAISEKDLFISRFIQVFLWKFLDAFLGSQIKAVQNVTHDIAKILTDNDQEVVFHITGYILRKLGHYEVLKVHKSDKPSENTPYKWTAKCDRGGLSYSSDNFYKFVLSLENCLRASINIDCLTSDALKVDYLLEILMENVSVKLSWEQISSDAAEIKVMEKVIKLFLTIRGFAISKYVQRQMAKTAAKTKQVKCSKKSVRKSLKCANLL